MGLDQVDWNALIKQCLNPKTCGLFGQLDMRGGGAAARHFGERSLNPLNPHVRPTSRISYES